MSNLLNCLSKNIRLVSYMRLIVRNESIGTITPKHKPNNIQKRILVWTKKFKSMEEVPNHVPMDMMERASSEARIKISNILMVCTGLGCIGYAISGKRAAARGESVLQNNLDWHKNYAEEYDRKKKEEEETKTVAIQ